MSLEKKVRSGKRILRNIYLPLTLGASLAHGGELQKIEVRGNSWEYSGEVLQHYVPQFGSYGREKSSPKSKTPFTFSGRVTPNGLEIAYSVVDSPTRKLKPTIDDTPEINPNETYLTFYVPSGAEDKFLKI
jgi:hypothetical protein